MSKSYRVVPDGSMWKVMKARQKARSGDELTILTSDGAIQSRVTVR